MIWQNKEALAVNIVASGASYYILLSLLSSHCYQDVKFPSAYLSSLLSVLRSFPLDSRCSSWLVTRKRRWREGESGGLLKIQSGPTEEEGRRLVGETEKQASRVSNLDLVTLSFSSVSLLTRLPSPAVRHLSDMNLIFNLFIFLGTPSFPLLFPFPFPFPLSHSLLSRPSGGNPTEQPVMKRTSHSGGRNWGLINQPKTCLPLCVTFLAEQKVISFPILASLTTVRDVERCYWSATVFSAPLFHNSYWKCQMLSDFCGRREGKCHNCAPWGSAGDYINT